jgi:hypothetical protein
MSPSIPLGVMIMEFTCNVISRVLPRVLLVTRLVGAVITVRPVSVRLVIVTTTITISPLVFVIVIVLERVVLRLAAIAVHMMVLHFLDLRKGELYPLGLHMISGSNYVITITCQQF